MCGLGPLLTALKSNLFTPTTPAAEMLLENYFMEILVIKVTNKNQHTFDFLFWHLK